MNLIEFAREMRSRGWRRIRSDRRVSIFSLRFADGVGVSEVIHLPTAGAANIHGAALAQYLTDCAGFTAAKIRKAAA